MIRIEIENQTYKISSDIAPTRFYEMENWSLGAAVENYVTTEIECDEE